MASSSEWASTTVANRSRTFFLSAGAIFDHGPCSKALRAALTALFTSSLFASAMLAKTFPLAGLIVSKVLPSTPGTGLPPITNWVEKSIVLDIFTLL